MKYMTFCARSFILVFVSMPAVSLWASDVSLTMPLITLDQSYLAARRDFQNKIAGIVKPINLNDKQALTVFAPFGGTKVSPFAELNVDGLILMGWERPGSLASIEKAFGRDKKILAASLNASQRAGAMSSSDVVAVSVSAQILGRLYLELGVTSVVMTQFVTRKSTLAQGSEESILRAWDGDTVSEDDDLLFTQFTFQWRGKQRELLFITHKIATDKASAAKATGPIAADELVNLLGGASGFKWAYVSADGMALFSGTQSNGFERASAAVLRLVRTGGGVILDYPMLPAYNTPQMDGDAIWMGGRAHLSKFGLSLAESIPLKTPLFGYSGHAAGDSVKVYRKMVKGPDADVEVMDAPIFSVAHLRKVGDATTFLIDPGSHP